MLRNLTDYLTRNGYIVACFNERQITVRQEQGAKVAYIKIPATWDEVMEFCGC